MERRTFLNTSAAGLVVAASPFGPAFAQGKKYRFGFSQVTTLEPWRVQFNKDMKR
jgi:ribose transport system substrate-binding protein